MRLIPLFTILITLLSGCVNLKSYQEIESSIPPIQEGEGRVFLANFTYIPLETKIDNVKKYSFSPKTFYYIDLQVGTHELYASIPNIFFELYGVYNIQIEDRKSYYVEVIENQQFLSAFNSRVRLILNSENSNAKRRWQQFGYIGQKIPINH